MTTRRWSLLLSALLLVTGGSVQPVTPSAAAQAESVSLETILAWFARVEGFSSEFREEKRLSLVAVPMLSEGSLYYQKQPRLLARHTRKPTQSSVLLRGDVVQFGDAKRSETVSLDAQPAVRLLVETFVHVLAGDLAALRKVADVKHSGLSPEAWRIDVVPKDPKLLKIVRTMSFEGRRAELTSMSMTDGHGDVTVTKFSKTRFGKLSPAEAKSAFRIGS